MVALRAAIAAAPPSAFLNAIAVFSATLYNPSPIEVALVRAKKLPSAVVTVVLVASAF